MLFLKDAHIGTQAGNVFTFSQYKIKDIFVV